MYTFNDLVGLRTLRVLTDDYHVPMSEIMKAATELKKRTDRPWSNIPLAVLKRKVVFDLDTEPKDADGQRVLKHIPLDKIASEVAKRAEALRNRNKALLGTSERHKFIAHNSYVLAGTRIPIAAVQSFIDEGYSDEDILAEYPSLTKIDVQFVRNPVKDAA